MGWAPHQRLRRFATCSAMLAAGFTLGLLALPILDVWCVATQTARGYRKREAGRQLRGWVVAAALLLGAACTPQLDPSLRQIPRGQSPTPHPPASANWRRFSLTFGSEDGDCATRVVWIWGDGEVATEHSVDCETWGGIEIKSHVFTHPTPRWVHVVVYGRHLGEEGVLAHDKLWVRP